MRTGVVQNVIWIVMTMITIFKSRGPQLLYHNILVLISHTGDA